MVHHLKTWPDSFEAIRTGAKVHEIRVNDRDYKAGDILVLKLYDPVKKQFVEADPIMREVTYITYGGTWGLPANLCVMSLKLSNP